MKKEVFLVCLLYVIVTSIFFYPIFKKYLPFPGDLLVGEYAPYNSYPFLGYQPGGFPNKGQDFDVLRLLYPAKEFTISMLKNGEFPLWNPYNFSGNPHLASLQSGTFYPLNIVFWFMPFISAWSLSIFIQPILASVFTYCLLRKLNLSLKSSFFGGLVFAFSSYFVVWLEYGNIGHTIIWLPFTMWLFLENIQKPGPLKSALLILALSFSIFAGYIQLAIYLFIYLFAFVFFYVFFIDKKNKLKKIFTSFLIFFIPLLLSAVQLLPSIELFINSTRSPYSTDSFIKLLIPQFNLATLFAPDFFGNPATRNYWLGGTYIERVLSIGVIPLFFVIYGLVEKRTKLVWFFVISASVIYLLTFDSFLARVIYSINLPIISTTVPSRSIFIFCFALSVLAAFGYNFFESNKSPKPLIKTGIIMGGIYLFLWFFVFVAPFIFKNSAWISNLSISKRNLLIPSLIYFSGITTLLFSLKANIIKKYIFIVVIALTVFELFYFFHKITPFSPVESVYPKTEILAYLKNIQGIDRSWGYGSGYIDANIQTLERIFATNGYDALHIKRYGELISSSKNGKIADPLPRSEADLVPGFGEDDLRNNFYRQKILNLMGVKYVLHKKNLLQPDYKTFDEKIYKLIWQKGGWQIYENKEVLPRIFFASDYFIENNKEKLIKKIFEKEFSPREKIILEEELSPKLDLRKDKESTIFVKDYTPNKVVLKTSSSTNMLLFISDNYFFGWKVSIDKEFGKIYRADYSFRAVPVKKGKHEVIFSYYPNSFSLGMKISLATLLSIATFIIFRRFYKINV